MGEAFERSKKISRTPTKFQREETEGKLDQILVMMREMSHDQKEMKKEQRDIKKETQEIMAQQKQFNEEIRRLKEENQFLKKENTEIRKENSEVRDELRNMKRVMEILEKESKKNNVVINGLKMTTNEPLVLKEHIKDFIKENLNIDTTPKSVTKIGEKTCVISLENEKEKNDIMANKSKLRYMSEDRIFISEDMTFKEREKQKKMRLVAKTEKEKGNTVKIGYNKIIINGEEWRWNKITESIVKQTSKN